MRAIASASLLTGRSLWLCGALVAHRFAAPAHGIRLLDRLRATPIQIGAYALYIAKLEGRVKLYSLKLSHYAARVRIALYFKGLHVEEIPPPPGGMAPCPWDWGSWP